MHVVRKVLPTMAVTTASATAAALLAVSFLTFLGIGVVPPAPTWGGVLSSDLDYLSQAPWAPFIPGLLIAVTVGALNALADAFRDRTRQGALPAGRPGHQDPFHPRELPWRPPVTGNPPPDEVLGIEDLDDCTRARRGRHRGPRYLLPSVHTGEIVGLVGESAAARR